MNEQELEGLKNKVKTAVHLFLANDGELLTLAGGIHEQTISHRIAVYLECLFRGFHVDCEYNKHGNGSKDIKRVNGINKARKNCECKACRRWQTEQKGKEEKNISNTVDIRPDIIVHKKRGDKSVGNILVIEIKKKEKCLFDEAKLIALTDRGGDYKYDLGVFIYFQNGNPTYKYYPEAGQR